MKQVRTSNRKRWSGIALSALALAFSVTGCSSIVDSNTPTTPKPAESDVRNYYIALESPKMEYHYISEATAPFYPANAGLVMDMHGYDSMHDGLPIYSCDWLYATDKSATPWYYGVTPEKVVAYGVEDANNNYSDSWVELQAPLAQNKSWSFVSLGEQITATVTKYGVSAEVEGKKYDDVIMVTYSGPRTSGTQWFARGIGTIFSHIERNGTYTEMRFQSREQK